MTLDGEPLTEAEIARDRSAQPRGLALIRGKWVELDRDRLREALDHWKKVESGRGAGRAQLLRGHAPALGSRASGEHRRRASDGAGGGMVRRVVAGAWLEERARRAARSGRAQRRLARRRGSAPSCGPIRRRASAGCGSSTRLGLGACLADDMGLGKTIQVLGAAAAREGGAAGGRAAGPRVATHRPRSSSPRR